MKDIFFSPQKTRFAASHSRGHHRIQCRHDLRAGCSICALGAQCPQQTCQNRSSLLAAFPGGMFILFSALAAGLATSPDGSTLYVANYQNDSLSIVDTATRAVSNEVTFFDAIGNLYSTTCCGGDSGASYGGEGCGTVFELTPKAGGRWTETAGRPASPQRPDIADCGLSPVPFR